MKPNSVAPQSAWSKSSYNSGAEGNCVTTAILGRRMAVRDSKLGFEEEQGVCCSSRPVPGPTFSAWSDAELVRSQGCSSSRKP
ncbi:DUF397 domain-containing protein [Streptomyces sp. NPDC001523]|uniref:DUF397 domain-containing protein n=1 Tax=Streptomyces sp. NPDC001523 TaxID=3154383 RepID=UPI0033196B36